MSSARRVRRAVALSSFDVPGAQELLLHGCEDCACPVTKNERERDVLVLVGRGRSNRQIGDLKSVTSAVEAEQDEGSNRYVVWRSLGLSRSFISANRYMARA